MSADVCIAYYGIRFDVQPDDIEGLEVRSDWRIKAARRARLKYYWGNFRSPDERYFLFIGTEVGVLGPEGDLEVRVSQPDLEEIFLSTQKKLTEAEITGDPELYLQWKPDV